MFFPLLRDLRKLCTSCESSVNYERQMLFTQKGRHIENIPPTRDALAHHLLKVGYIASHIWQQSTTKDFTLAVVGTPKVHSGKYNG